MTLTIDYGYIMKSVCNLENIKDCTSIFLSIVTGVSVIKGLNYLKGLKEKTNAATFTFWSQFRIRIYELMNWLEADNTLIDNLYELKLRDAWESELTQDSDRVEIYKEKVKETIEYIEKTPDQMPAYIGWTSDYTKIIGFLNDLIQYDICNPKKYFKFSSNQTIKDKKQYCDDICKTMRKLCEKIEQKQREIEKDIL